MADTPLTWNQVKNWWPIFGAIVAITIYLVSSFSDIRGEQKSIQNKLDDLIAIEKESQKSLISWKYQLEDRLGKEEIRVAIIESEHKQLFK